MPWGILGEDEISHLLEEQGDEIDKHSKRE